MMPASRLSKVAKRGCAPAATGAAGAGARPASIATAGNAMTVNQTTDKAIISWNQFNIGSAASVTFQHTGFGYAVHRGAFALGQHVGFAEWPS